MGLTALRLAASLVLLAACGTAAPGEQPPSSPLALIAIRMVTPQVGWGLTEHRLLRTGDGGHVWQAVPMPLPRGVYSMLDLNVAFAVHGANRVWLVPSIPVRQGPPRSAVLSTMDGGRHWHRSSPIRGAAGSISWVTPDTGYILTGEGAAAGSIPTDLYRTGDGGRRWTLVAYNHLMSHSPDSLGACGGAISFANPRVGTAAGSCGAAPQLLVLYRTTDGGRRWHRQSLPPPPGIRPGYRTLSAPTYVGRDGALPAIVGPPASFYLYVTHDDGATWTPTATLRSSHPLELPDAFALPPHRAWSWLDNTLFGTTDGARSWRRLARLPFASPPELDFPTPQMGFALGMGNAVHTVTWVLRATADGGHTWQALQPRIG